MKYEPSKNCTTTGIKENKFITSYLQGPLEPDSKNTDQLIKTSVVNEYKQFTTRNKQQESEKECVLSFEDD